MGKITVLVTSAGVESAVNIIKSLRLQKELDVEILAFDVDRFASGLYLADRHFVSPPISEREVYWDFVQGICRDNKVRALYSCFSREIAFFAERRSALKDLGVATLLPSHEVISLCDDKHESIGAVHALGIPVPRIIDDPKEEDLPIFSKLLKGSSSRGATLIDSIHMLRYLKNSSDRRLYQQYIPGTEYTVDVLCDEDSLVISCCPRKRISVKAGQTVKGITATVETLNDYVKRICRIFRFVGVCNIQFIEHDGKFYFIEINPRYAAGGLMLTVHAGSNLPLLALKLMLGIPLSAVEIEHRPGVVMTRYWNEIILDSASIV